MKLYSYVVARDFGFAPNPFYEICTLATCKPRIRAYASVADWVVGTGGAKYGLRGNLVFAMIISEILTFNEYWDDPRFLKKRPYLPGSLKQAYGDNIYHQDNNSNNWLQADSHHSLENGVPNPLNVEDDTKTPNVLIGENFSYWGKLAPRIPNRFRNFGGLDICAIRHHKCKFPNNLVMAFTDWITSLDEKGYIGDPSEF